jgi:hypothetical protein
MGTRGDGTVSGGGWRLRVAGGGHTERRAGSAKVQIGAELLCKGAKVGARGTREGAWGKVTWGQEAQSLEARRLRGSVERKSIFGSRSQQPYIR